MNALYVVVSDINKVAKELIDKETDKRPVGLTYNARGKDVFETPCLSVAKQYALEMNEMNHLRFPNIEYIVCKCIPIDKIGE